MRSIILLASAVLLVAGESMASADEITDAIDQGRKAYQGNDLANAKQSLDLASQLIGQKNAEAFGKLLPAALSGWTAEEVQTTAVGAVGFGAWTASRAYQRANGDRIEVQITGDSAIIMQYATFLSNPQIAGAMGKIVTVGQPARVAEPGRRHPHDRCQQISGRSARQRLPSRQDGLCQRCRHRSLVEDLGRPPARLGNAGKFTSSAGPVRLV